MVESFFGHSTQQMRPRLWGEILNTIFKIEISLLPAILAFMKTALPSCQAFDLTRTSRLE